MCVFLRALTASGLERKGTFSLSHGEKAMNITVKNIGPFCNKTETRTTKGEVTRRMYERGRFMRSAVLFLLLRLSPALVLS